eukprot:GFYU01009816.1.p1 GENE.GFYU01009816.1~~GFYU01009816.1.p1  ORF type:complete len:392 (-),score=93.59 GFYU01009816.1:16-1191(-)
MSHLKWNIINPAGKFRVVVTKNLPGEKWFQVLQRYDCKVEVCLDDKKLSVEELKECIGEKCDAVLGQLTEPWNEETLGALKKAGGKLYSQMAVGHDNVDVAAASRIGLPVGNTPGVLTDTTAQMAVALTYAAARNIVQGDRMMRAGEFHGWLPNMLVGHLLANKTIGIVGAGRIGGAYARIMAEATRSSVVYYSSSGRRNEGLEQYIANFSQFLKTNAALLDESVPNITCRMTTDLDEMLRESDIVSLHCPLNEATRHLINKEKLELMKPNALLINTARGPVVDEKALVEHCRNNPAFTAGLDVYEREPAMEPGLETLENVTLAPHIASATMWTRGGMASIAACNIVGILSGYPLAAAEDILKFVDSEEKDFPQQCPSIINWDATVASPSQ